jgi:hypothetical protein
VNIAYRSRRSGSGVAEPVRLCLPYIIAAMRPPERSAACRSGGDFAR